jgi:hypothetical protein
LFGELFVNALAVEQGAAGGDGEEVEAHCKERGTVAVALLSPHDVEIGNERDVMIIPDVVVAQVGKLIQKPAS